MNPTPPPSNAAWPDYTVRVDPMHGWPVFYASPRALRPFDFQSRKSPACSEQDPFAEGREHITTPESLAIRDPDSAPNSPGWQVRIIPNKYPALLEHSSSAEISNQSACPQVVSGAEQATAEPSPSPVEWITLDSERDCRGVHEVIIECPQRETHFARLSADQQLHVLRAMRARLGELAQRPELAHATIFKNQGPGAGASLAHAHSQLIATTFVPPAIRQEIEFFQAGKQHTQTDSQTEADWLHQELRDGIRCVEFTPDMLAFCPEVSRFALETHFYPLALEPDFQRTTDETLRQLRDLLSGVLNRLRDVAHDPDFNLVLHTAPFHVPAPVGFRWHWELYPRLAGIAGWELGAGGYVNPLLPERAAQILQPPA